MTTTTKTTKAAGTKAAGKAERVTRVTQSAPTLRDVTATIIADVASGKATASEALAMVTKLDAAITKASVLDTIATLRVVGAVAVHEFSTPSDAKAGKLPAAQAIADAFVRSDAGKASGRQAGSVKQAVDLFRVVDIWTALDIWQRCMTLDSAKASDPKAYAVSAQAFLRWNAARKANRVNLDTGIVYGTKDAAAASDANVTAAVVSATISEAAKAKADAARKVSVKSARAMAKASDGKIGSIPISAVAALTPSQRAALAKLLKSLD